MLRTANTFDKKVQFARNISLFTHHSLIGLLPQEHRLFGEIWNIFKTGEALVFQSKTDIFIYHQDKKKIEVCAGNMRKDCSAPTAISARAMPLPSMLASSIWALARDSL